MLKMNQKNESEHVININEKLRCSWYLQNLDFCVRSAVKTCFFVIQVWVNDDKIDEKSTQNRCLKTAAKTNPKMSPHSPKWGPECVKNRSNNVSKINRKNISENGRFQEAQGIPNREQRAEPHTGAGISGPPSYRKST